MVVRRWLLAAMLAWANLALADNPEGVKVRALDLPGLSVIFGGMWVANIVIGALGCYLTYRVGREALIIHWSIFRRLIPRRWRTALPDEEPADALTP